MADRRVRVALLRRVGARHSSPPSAHRSREKGGGASRLDPAALCETVGQALRRARAQEASIRQTIMESELPSELTNDVDALVTAFEATARRADIIYRTLERQQENFGPGPKPTSPPASISSSAPGGPALLTGRSWTP